VIGGKRPLAALFLERRETGIAAKRHKKRKKRKEVKV
jgi:hypothetical protein